jgi:hypothetical protein
VGIPWHRGLFEEAVSRRLITMLGKHQIKRIAKFINSALPVNPFALDFHIAFIHSPGNSVLINMNYTLG